MTEEYSAQQITVLEGLEPVRKRPGMYIGGTGIEGLHHLIWEVLDNSIDEAMAGHATMVLIDLNEDGSVSVEDDGRGIPVDMHPVTKVSALETVLTKLHAGGKFGAGGYKVSGGLHGVGVSVVNALSEYVKAEVFKDGKVYMQEYKRGNPQHPVKPVGTTDKIGTRITFKPDHEIFPRIQFNRGTVIDHTRQQAYLTKGIKIKITDNRPVDTLTSDEKNLPHIFNFYYQGGIGAYVAHLTRHKKRIIADPIYFAKQIDESFVEVALTYVDDYNEHIYTFANNIHTTEGGTHLTGFRSALTRVITEQSKKISEKDASGLSGEDIREGLTAVVSVKLSDPEFEGQTKAKLGTPSMRGHVETVVNQHLSKYFDEHPQEVKTVFEKVALSAKARMAARAAKEAVVRKGALDGMTLPGKLADCSEKDPAKSEVFIVEGESAGGSSKQGRDRRFQAILPLRGKILNVERARIDRMLSNEEIKSLIVAFGVGIGEDKNPKKLRYHRIIIMTDADVDGSHIRTLLLTFFYRHYLELIEQGFVYIAQPPLYKISYKKESHYAYTEEQKDEVVKKMRVGDAKQGSINLQRYKGLGEMNPEQLWETTLNPENRILLRVDVDDAEKADTLFSDLMGEDVLPRKRFIQANASEVKNLDI